MTPTSMAQEFADLINEHTAYCVKQYQPHKNPNTPPEKVLKFQDEMCKSLAHFGMWLETVKLKEPHND